MAKSSDPRFSKSWPPKTGNSDPRFGPGWPPAKKPSDPRFKAGQAGPPPRKFAAEGRGGGSTETSRRLHAESDRKNQYDKKVVCERAPYARIE
jgi:hypothetical protein